jgi:hypothetical protein
MNDEAKPDIVVCEHLDLASSRGTEMVLCNPRMCGKEMEQLGRFLLQASSRALEFLMHPTYYLLLATRFNSFFVRADLIDKFV